MQILILSMLTLVIVTTRVASVTAQDLTPESAQKPAENLNEIEEQAYLALEGVVAGTQTLKLPENRSRLEIAAADLLWKRDQARARSLFSEAASNIVELARQTARKREEPFGQYPSATELRQELVLTVVRRDAALAYQLFQRTQQTVSLPDSRRPESDTYLEQLLLTQVMTTDPDLALSKVEEMLDRGKYSTGIVSLLEQLQDRDQHAAARLTDKILGRLQGDDLLTNYDAVSLALRILWAGPRAAEPASSKSTGNAPLLGVSAYQRLLETVVTTALKPNISSKLRGGQLPESGRQQNDLLLNLRSLLPQVERYLPARYPAVCQKVNELNDGSNSRAGLDQLAYLTQQGTSNNLLLAAATAPSAVQDRLYQEAALKALDEGSVESARQIANDHLDTDMRNVVFERIAAQQQLRKGKAAQLEELRQMLAEMTSKHDRVRLLLRLAEVTKSDNPKKSSEFLDEACGLASDRGTSYRQLEDQLQVVRALAPINPARSLELLESGINQLNELLSAAASLSGFEVHIFVHGEMPLPGNSQLGAMVVHYGQELSILAKSDFPRALTAAEHFQYPEARLLARLSVVQAVLGRR